MLHCGITTFRPVRPRWARPRRERFPACIAGDGSREAGMQAAATQSYVDPAMPHFTHQQILRVLSGILLCIFLAAIDQTVVIPAVPAIAADLHGFDHLAWIISAYLLTSTAM